MAVTRVWYWTPVSHLLHTSDKAETWQKNRMLKSLAEEQYKKAMEIDPNSAMVHY